MNLLYSNKLKMIKNIIIGILLLLLIWVWSWKISPLQINKLWSNTISSTKVLYDSNKKYLINWNKVTINEILSTNWNILMKYWSKNISLLLSDPKISPTQKAELLKKTIQ